jgi:formiminotetrahydrofolate cyclodeaminase
MVARLTIGRCPCREARATEILHEAERLRTQLRRLVDEDAASYELVSKAYKIPKDDPGRTSSVDNALLAASRPPQQVVQAAEQVKRLAEEIGMIGNKNAASDARVAGMLADAAIAGAAENVKVNLAGVSKPPTTPR